MRKKVISIILLILWAGLIFYLSNQSGDISDSQSGTMIKAVLPVSEQTFNIIHNPLRELMHVIEFVIFGLLLFNVLVDFNSKHSMIICFTVSLIYAILDEVHQLYVPGRAFEMLDIFVDTIGIVIALVMYFNFTSCMKTKNDL